MMAPIIQAKSLRFETAANPPRLALDCDRERMLQILSNLLDTAMKVTPDSGAVSVHVEPLRESPGWVRFAVANSGPPVPEEERAHFFAQAWPAANPGGGLGLFLAKRLIEAHDGRVWLETGKNSGTTFCFALKAA
jgi:signal transduction histidine kinase